MNLTPTNHSLIFQTEYFTDPTHPLIETKIFYAKLDNVLYYISVHRGPTTDDLAASPEEVSSVELNDAEGYANDEQKAFQKLVKAIEKK